MSKEDGLIRFVRKDATTFCHELQACRRCGYSDGDIKRGGSIVCFGVITFEDLNRNQAEGEVNHGTRDRT